MIDPARFVDALKVSGVGFFTGVPDSLLKAVCACIASREAERHIPATNEGSAIGLAIGWYLGTGRPALVYMQNSGLGNAVNPITSLADDKVYGIPMVLLIGWRGELTDSGQLKDEPQHVKQGAITPSLLDVLGAPYAVVDQHTDYTGTIAKLCQRSLAERRPVALLVRKNTFSAFPPPAAPSDSFDLSREAAIRLVLEAIPADTRLVSTTGMASRELFELREARSEGHDRDFLTVGGMGHASQIAAGLAVARPDLKVLCLDGDGAVLMHSGALAVASSIPNLVHIVLNNKRHDSVGGQPTHASHLDLSEIARSFGYARVARVSTADALIAQMRDSMAADGNSLIEVMCHAGARSDLGRPTRTARQNIDDFMHALPALPDSGL